jgi:hypothetical protein
MAVAAQQLGPHSPHPLISDHTDICSSHPHGTVSPSSRGSPHSSHEVGTVHPGLEPRVCSCEQLLCLTAHTTFIWTHQHPSSGILKTRKHNVSETGSVSTLGWRWSIKQYYNIKLIKEQRHFSQAKLYDYIFHQLLMWFWPLNDMICPYVRFSCG